MIYKYTWRKIVLGGVNRCRGDSEHPLPSAADSYGSPNVCFSTDACILSTAWTLIKLKISRTIMKYRATDSDDRDASFPHPMWISAAARRCYCWRCWCCATETTRWRHKKKSRLKQTVDNVVRRQFPVFSVPAICRSRLQNSVDHAVTYILSTCLDCRIMHAENAAGTLIYESIFTKTKQKRRLEVIAVSSVAVVDVRSVI